MAIDISGPGQLARLDLVHGPLVVVLRDLEVDVERRPAPGGSSGSSSRPKWRTISMRRVTFAEAEPPPAPPAPIDARSFISVVSATVQPWFTSPRRWSSGTRTSVKNTSLNDGAAGHLAQRPDLDAGRVHVDDEAGEALVLGQVGVGAADDLADVAVLRARGPHLLAVDDPLVAVALGPGLQAGAGRSRRRAR